MDIQHADNGAKGVFYIEVDGETQAEMTYVWSGGMFIIDHTSVSEALKGKNVGKQLVEKAVAFALEKGVRIMPLCPFAKAVMQKTASFQDVLFA